MKVPEGALRDAIEATVTDWAATEPQQEVIRSTCRSFVRALGIEIVPDPEPELPPRPWILEIGERVVIRASDGSVVVDIREVFGNPERLRPALGAYNAAGERKRIEIWLGKDGVSNEDHGGYDGRDDAVGAYVVAHQEELGVVIMEHA